MTLDPNVEPEQIARLAAFRARRDAGRVESLRADLVAAAREGRNLMPPIVEAVDGNVTLGEIVESLKTVFGDHRDTVGL
jgi:methylmalonyl-CoA mutase N-terminal domain/subunit